MGIIVAAGIAAFVTSMNNMRQKEAVNTIDTIYTAEKNYIFENYSTVLACAGVSDCNTKLHLSIPLTTSCAYAASDSGGGAFCVQADCTGTFGKLKKTSSSNSFTLGSLCP